MRLSKRLKRNAVWTVARLSDRFLNILPRSTAVAIGGWIGLAAWAILPRDRYNINRHLEMIYRDKLTDHERRQIGRGFFVNSGKNLVDVVRFKRHFAAEIKPLVTVEGLEHFDRAYRAGHGLIATTGHLGNFELGAAYMAGLGYSVGVIGRELADPRLDRWLTTNRAAAGLRNFTTTESPRHILAWLKEGKVLGVLIDTDSIRRRGVFVPAFGRLSYTAVGQTLLGIRTGAAFVPMACVREAGNRYKMVISPPVEYDRSLPEEELLVSVTAKCTKALEEIIERYRAQWIWLHNRWHTRPDQTS
jgi:KDO2-lipid IV(A) lauroyltransferase